MPISLKCSCGKQYTLRDEHAGKTMKCKVCAERIQVPSPAATSTPPQAMAPVILDDPPAKVEPVEEYEDYGSEFDDFGAYEEQTALPPSRPRSKSSGSGKSRKKKKSRSKKKSSTDEKEDPPWVGLLCSIGAIGFGFLMLFLFGNLEKNGGSMRLPVWVIAIYKLTGKWGLFGIFFVVGVLGAIVSILQMVGVIKPSDDD